VAASSKPPGAATLFLSESPDLMSYVWTRIISSEIGERVSGSRKVLIRSRTDEIQSAGNAGKFTQPAAQSFYTVRPDGLLVVSIRLEIPADDSRHECGRGGHAGYHHNHPFDRLALMAGLRLLAFSRAPGADLDAVMVENRERISDQEQR
jgi:hypothetical protein